MKNFSAKTLAAGIIAAIILLSSCKKTEGPQGPAGPQGPSGVVTTSSDGFIKGTFSGTRRDGTVFNESFNFPNYWGGVACSLDSASFGFDFYIRRGTDILSDNYASLDITSISKTNFSTATATLNFTFVKSLGTNKEFLFDTYGSTPVLTGVSYNTSTGQLTGSFSVTVNGSNNNTGNNATISGTFQTTVTQLYYRMAHH